MAVGGLEVEIVAGGMEERPASRGPWVQNMWKPSGRPDWETRPGFGQVAQIDTTLSSSPGFSVERWGYTKFLGASSVRSSWGAEQVVSVFAAQVISGHADAGVASRWTPAYLVSIFDVTTSQRWEEVIFRHTSENKGGPTIMPKWRGHFESYESVDPQKFVAVIEVPFYFHTFNQTLFFGNKFTGVLAYKPSDYRKPRHQTVPSVYEAGYIKGYSESSRVVRVVPVDGLNPESFSYRNETEIPEIVDIRSLGTRLVMASKDGLFFSDPQVPNSFVGDNVAAVPSEQDIVAVSSINNVIMVFTKSETFAYQPSSGSADGLVTATGRFTLVSGSIGCLGPMSNLSDGEVLYWVDRNGVHGTSNGLAIKDLSAGISPFFGTGASRTGITSPLNHFLTASGAADPTADEQPRTLYRLEDDEMVSMALWPESGALFVSSPANNIVWCLTQNQWSMWNLESSVSTTAGGASQVGVQRNITNPFVLNVDNKLHVLGGLDLESFTGAVPLTPLTVESSSYYLLECGRGGALDRSIKDEDQRYVSAKYRSAYVGAGANTGRFYIEEPKYDAVTGEYWMLVSIVTNRFIPRVDGATLRFSYDNAAWVLNGAVTLPTERLANAAGFALTFPAAQTAQIDYASVTPLETAPGQKNPFFILRWSPTSALTTKLRLNVAPTIATMTFAAITVNMNVYCWQFHSGPLNANDNVAQPVDWVYRSGQVGVENQEQIKSRGLFTRFISQGKATTQLNTGWLWGLFNTLAAPDWKGWSSQIMDFAGEPKSLVEIAAKTTIRTRFKDTLGRLSYRTFNSPSVPPPTPPSYATPGAPSDNDYLVDDAEYDTVATSDSTRGEHVTYMLFGFIRNQAEKLVLASSRVLIRTGQGGPRRKGR